MGFDEVGRTLEFIILRWAEKDFASEEILAHELNLAHELAGGLFGFFGEVFGSAEHNRAKILGTSFVVLPLFMTGFVVLWVYVVDTTP